MPHRTSTSKAASSKDLSAGDLWRFQSRSKDGRFKKTRGWTKLVGKRADTSKKSRPRRTKKTTQVARHRPRKHQRSPVSLPFPEDDDSKGKRGSGKGNKDGGVPWSRLPPPPADKKKLWPTIADSEPIRSPAIPADVAPARVPHHQHPRPEPPPPRYHRYHHRARMPPPPLPVDSEVSEEDDRSVASSSYTETDGGSHHSSSSSEEEEDLSPSDTDTTNAGVSEFSDTGDDDDSPNSPHDRMVHRRDDDDPDRHRHHKDPHHHHHHRP